VKIISFVRDYRNFTNVNGFSQIFWKYFS